MRRAAGARCHTQAPQRSNASTFGPEGGRSAAGRGAASWGNPGKPRPGSFGNAACPAVPLAGPVGPVLAAALWILAADARWNGSSAHLLLALRVVIFLPGGRFYLVFLQVRLSLLRPFPCSSGSCQFLLGSLYHRVSGFICC